MSRNTRERASRATGLRAGLLGPAAVGVLVLVLVVAATAFGGGSGRADLAAAKAPADKTAPSVSVTFPSAGGAYRSSAWAAGCSPAGACGTASDPSGVTAVKVAVQQAATGRYWNGSNGFTLSPRTFFTATGTTAWKYALAAPADGSYTVYVQATDGAGNTTPPSSAPATTFRIDNTAPPVPALTKKPDDPTAKDSAQFNWTDAEAGVSFRCALDGGSPAPCGPSGNEYTDLGAGDHCFAVVAVDAAGNTSAARSFCWTVTASQSFGIAGDAATRFSPGAQERLDLRLSNPHNFAIRVTELTVEVQPATMRGGVPNGDCSGTKHMRVVEQLGVAVDVPANTNGSLSGLGVAPGDRPLVEMRDLDENQDGCKNTTFAFTYTGTAVKP